MPKARPPRAPMTGMEIARDAAALAGLPVDAIDRLLTDPVGAATAALHEFLAQENGTMPSKNGVSEETARLDLPPQTVFGRFGEAVRVAGNDYRLQVRTTSGIIELVKFINDSNLQTLLTPSGLPGDMLVAGAIQSAATADAVQRALAAQREQAEALGQPLPESPAPTGPTGMAALRELLGMMIVEPLPEGIEYRADPAELGAAINKFFRHAGLDWLELVLKNSAARATALMETAMTQALTTANRR